MEYSNDILVCRKNKHRSVLEHAKKDVKIDPFYLNFNNSIHLEFKLFL